MGNKIPVTSEAIIPTFVADGLTFSGGIATMTFSGGAPPTNGDLALCFVVLNVSTGYSYRGGPYQRLLFWSDNEVGKAEITDGFGSNFNAKVPTWSFVALGLDPTD